MIINVFTSFLLAAVLTANFGSGNTAPAKILKPETAKYFSEVAESVFLSANASTSIPFGLPKIEDRYTWPKLLDLNSLGVEVSAQSAIVVDRDSGKFLFEKEADALRPIASITKLMTALVFLDTKPDLKRIIAIEPSDLLAKGGGIFKAGDKISLNDLLTASLAASSNEAVNALVRNSGLDETEFVARMNKKAQFFGMKKTRFLEPTGLDSRNVSTARELVELFKISRDAPEIQKATQSDFAQLNTISKKRELPSTDLLLRSFLNKEPYRIAIGKTGSLDEAGFCLGVSVDKENNGIYVIVLGSDNHFSRFSDAKALAYWAFSRWQWKIN